MSLNPPSPRRLPGVRFEVPPRAPDDVLPRMDIAFFVGFAASGPLTAAVAVESLVEFETVFGPGLVLARDAASGLPVQGLLHPAVRGFFSQGGRRCWVLRVAGAGARTSRFALPSLLCARRNAQGDRWHLAPATLVARSPGSGADGVQVAARVSGMLLRARILERDSEHITLQSGAMPALTPRTGDVVRLALDDVRVHALVVEVTALDADDAGLAALRIVLAGLVALQPMQATSPARLPSGICLAEFDDFSRAPTMTTVVHGEWLDDGRLAVRARVAAQRLPQRGEVVGLAFGSGAVDAWMALDEVELTEAVGLDGQIEAALAGSPWQEADAAWRLDVEAWRTSGREHAVQLLRLDLQARTAPNVHIALDGLSMGSHAEVRNAGQSVFDLPDDEGVFARDTSLSDPGPAAQQLAQRDALGRLRSRFPLASDRPSGECMLLPLDELDDFDAQLGALRDPLGALERDGLTRFGWTLFAEATLANYSCDLLAERAEALRIAGRVPLPLRGMHAAFGGNPPVFVDEPTLLAVPDAVHAGWRPIDQPASAWTQLDALPELPDPCADEAFRDCAASPLPRPRFVRGADPLADGSFTLYWTQAIDGAQYELQESLEAGFGAAVPVYDGHATRHDVTGRRSGEAYYRVRARLGRRISPWSAPVKIEIGTYGYETVPWQQGELLAIHRLMLRTAAGRGDMLALLAAPAHFDVFQAAQYAATLRSTRSEASDAAGPGAIGDGETRALSHGALHHPWLMLRRDENVIWFPPDGSMCGQLAAGALERGAWIAVANQPLRDVVALDAVGMRPTLQQRQQMLDAQVNLLRSAPIGFVSSTADTLTPDAEWRPINVRRLMCLLRRLALRHGLTYVFEPNGDILRRTVERGFKAVLDDLFRRGAFAGARAETAYRVNVSDEVNSPHRRDAGQFWIELKVAPALPMSFLTVRLSRSGERVLSRESH
ncbi:hypothetical protein QTI24_24630 [Variovorax sp. J22P240]|uniref:hypothetical protein n=1 Tax=Variovorax sp. J22P240 TaxID=3053514 RepID=UPI002577EED7|nr:hypothetical protein [Variovorax sp. J22P240]MDM0001817.1 hypothetical protein [Variovorax sp. J22P240]